MKEAATDRTVGGDHIAHRVERPPVGGLEGGRDDLGDPEEAETAIEEGRNRDLIGRVENCRRGSTLTPRLESQVQGGERHRIWSFEREAHPCQVEGTARDGARSGEVNAYWIGILMSG